MARSNVNTLGGDDPLYDTKEKLLRKVTSLEEQVYALAQAIDKHRELAEETNILVKRQSKRAAGIGRIWAWFKGALKHAAETADRIRIE